jgi:UDPglucose--hexose-1-phosphate uridylyltransferase
MHLSPAVPRALGRLATTRKGSVCRRVRAYILQSAPEHDQRRSSFVWSLRLVPRLHTPGGFEFGSGLAVNPTSPEEAAAQLRAAIRPESARPEADSPLG